MKVIKFSILFLLMLTTISFCYGQLVSLKDVRAISFTPDNKYAITICHDGIIKYWDLSTGTDRKSVV